MLEAVVLNYLADKISVPVLMEMPEVPSEEFTVLPDEFILIEKLAGSKRNHIRKDSFAFQSYARSLLRAIKLDEEVQEAMDALIELPDIYASKLASDYNFTDTEIKRYRYQCTYDITY